MPNQPDPNKILVGVRTPRELAAVLTREAQEQGLKLPALIVRILQQYVGDPSQKLSRFELEDVEAAKQAARLEDGSRRSAGRREHARRERYEPELVTGESGAPVSDMVWRTTLDNLSVGWHLEDEEDGFCLSSKRVPGNAGVHYQDGCYMLYANYWGEDNLAEFSKPLKWRYAGSRSRGSWRVPLHEPALGLNLRPLQEGELIPYIRSGKDEALRKLEEKLRELIACLRAHHRRALWCRTVRQVVESAGWCVYAENWRFLNCMRVESDKQVGRVHLRVYEPIESESLRFELLLESGSSGHLRTLLRAMGRSDLAREVRGGFVELERVDFALTPSGMPDEEKSAQRLVPRLSKWMERVNRCLERGLPLEKFVALAVETANHDFSSVCDLGVVWVRGGEVVKSMRYLVRPEGNEYDEMFTEWHGISAADTKDAPSFAEVWAEVEPKLRRMPLVVHSGGVVARLNAVFSKYELPRPEFSLLRNLAIARERFPELPSHNLYDLAEYIGHPITSTGALPKAEACANIALMLYNTKSDAQENPVPVEEKQEQAEGEKVEQREGE